MKHRAWMLAAFAAAGVIFLSACTSSEEEIAQDVRTESSGNAGVPDAGNGGSAEEQPAASQQDMPQDAVSDTGTPDAAGEQAQTDAPQEADSARTESEAAQVPQDSAADAALEDIWSGTYASEQETVTISLINAESFSFSFENAGIASTAEADGNTAVYHGDDYHDVVFNMSEGVLNITVSSEEDYDASASPLNGTYVRQN